MTDPKSWLSQKLAQNGFTLADLSAQSGIDEKTLEKMSGLEEAKGSQWDAVLSVLNDYPVLYLPSADLLEDIQSRIDASDGQEMCTVFYGVNQSELIFAVCQFEDGQVRGANVPTTYLRQLHVTLQEALDLFRAQSMAVTNAALE